MYQSIEAAVRFGEEKGQTDNPLKLREMQPAPKKIGDLCVWGGGVL